MDMSEDWKYLCLNIPYSSMPACVQAKAKRTNDKTRELWFPTMAAGGPFIRPSSLFIHKQFLYDSDSDDGEFSNEGHKSIIQFLFGTVLVLPL